jgi:hypothetical protein
MFGKKEEVLLHTVNICRSDGHIFLQYGKVSLDEVNEIIKFVKFSNQHTDLKQLYIEIHPH